MDPEKGGVGGALGGFVGLFFETGEEGLEPFKRGGVLGDPDEFHTTEAGRGVRTIAQVPDVF